MKRISVLSVANAVLIMAMTCGVAPRAAAAGFNGKVGLQLYSLREQLSKDVPGTLDEVQRWGIKYVELAGTYGLSPEKFKAELDKRGIHAISAHFPYDRYRDDPEGVAKEAKTLGLKYAGCAYIPHQGKFDEQACRKVIADFNHAGEVLAKHGLKFFYHTHGFEFEPYKDGTIFDLLVSETNPKYVNFEMDIFWVVHPGQDPVKFFQKYGSRWQLTHLKDMKKGTPTGPDAPPAKVDDDAALGTGQMDMPAILRAAEKAGVKYNFIEDESSHSEQQIPISLQYLKTVKLPR